MKKMKRFLSLLLCMLMLASFMPISAAAVAYFASVTVTVPSNRDGRTVEDVVKDITATAYPRNSITGTKVDVIPENPSITYSNGNDNVKVTLTLKTTNEDYFWIFNNFNNSVTIQNATRDGNVSKSNDHHTMTVPVRFSMTHSHKGVLVPAQETSCVMLGTKAYYKCACDKNYEDEACQNEIADLNTWKAFGAHKLELVPAKAATCTEDGYQAYYKCTNRGCGKFFSDEAMTQEITEAEWKSGDGKIAAGHTYGAYSHDDTHHWKQCTLENCPAKEASVKDYGEHVYDPAETGTICTVCQYNRGVEITFDFQYQNKTEKKTVVKGATVEAPASPARHQNNHEYKVVGWYTDSRLTQKFDITQPVTESRTVYAKWAMVHELTYHGPDGSVVGTQEVFHGDTAGSFNPIEPISVPGYKTPSTWYRNQNPLRNEFVFETYVVNNCTDLYGKWETEKYTIKFMDGETELDTITKDYNAAIAASEHPATPTKKGHTFAGWDIEVPSTMPAENLTITASWTVNQYKVTFKNGDEVVKEETLDYGAAIVAPADPSKTGYTFEGWGDVPATMPDHDVVVEAEWSRDTFTVKLHGNGGAPLSRTGEPDMVLSINCGESFTLPTFTREGYTLSGWQTEDGATSYDPGATVTLPADKGEVIDLYAQWTVNQYKLTFKNGDEIVKEETLDYGAAIVAPADPTKDGYTFKGWGEVPATMPAEDQTFTAVWEEIPVVRYAITYYENNGTDNNWTTVVVQGTDYVIESATGIEAPAGKVFKHWKVKDGTKTYKPGDKIEKIADDYEFEAVWTKKTAASDLDYVPAAGDNFPVLLWAGMILFGAIALVETVSTRKKRS